MAKFGSLMGALWMGVGNACRKQLLVNAFITQGGPYAKIVDVHKGTACLLDEFNIGDNPTPSECEWEAKVKCASLSMVATEEERQECASIPCEVCCTMRFATIRKKIRRPQYSHPIYELGAITCNTALPGEDSTHLECKKKCQSSDDVIPTVLVTEDVSLPVFQALIDLTDVHHPSAAQARPLPALNTTKTPPETLPPPAVAAWITPYRDAVETMYTNRQLPSEEDLLDKNAPAPTFDKEKVSRTNNEIIAQLPTS